MRSVTVNASKSQEGRNSSCRSWRILEGFAHHLAFLFTPLSDPSKKPEASGPPGPPTPLVPMVTDPGLHLSRRPALLTSAENFTVLIKNNIDFPGHNYTA